MPPNWKTDLGPMRWVLYFAVILTLPAVFFADSPPEGFGIYSGYIAPAMTVIFFFVLLLDAVMNRVFMIEQEEARRQVLRLRLRADLLFVALIVLFWGPFLYQLTEYAD